MQLALPAEQPEAAFLRRAQRGVVAAHVAVEGRVGLHQRALERGDGHVGVRMLGQSSPKTSLNRRRYSGTKASRASIMSSSPCPPPRPGRRSAPGTPATWRTPAQKSLP